MQKLTKVLRVRVDKSLYKFLCDVSKETGVDIASMIRNIIVYFFVLYMTGQLRKDYKTATKEFLNGLNKGKRK